jgi:hypothetical protein
VRQGHLRPRWRDRLRRSWTHSAPAYTRAATRSTAHIGR